MAATPKTMARREALLDLLRANHASGLTLDQMARSLSVPRQIVCDDIRALRMDPDTDNIPATPNGFREPWVYRLTNDDEENRAWAVNRTADMEARFTTMVGQAATLVKVTDGRSLAGKKARKIERVLTYLNAELVELAEVYAKNGVPA